MVLERKEMKSDGRLNSWSWLYKLGGVASLILFVSFLVGASWLVWRPTGWIASLQNNWLVVLYRINATNASEDLLIAQNAIDLIIFFLFAVLFVALGAALWRTNRLWASVSAVLTFLGFILFLITNQAGRSALLLGSIIIGIIMLRSDSFSKPAGYVGIAGGALLLVAGDFATAMFPPSMFIAASIALGYLLWIAWFLMIGQSLLQSGSNEHKSSWAS
jgi:hypothetical protein